MKKMVVGVMICLSLLLGCAPKYQIVLKDGQKLKADTKPELNKDTGYYHYVDQDGRKVQLKEADVLLIKER
ncbi:MAG: YgdI/YgdR family lipoprotein [Proteobacteria bacterium]|nr:YgdI/YgdR family lipoprotein [Pseudomonadota bacterium]